MRKVLAHLMRSWRDWRDRRRMARRDGRYAAFARSVPVGVCEGSLGVDQ